VVIEGDKAVVIDPAPDSFDRIMSFLSERNLLLESVWITHSHWDHVAGCKQLLELGPVDVMVHTLDAENLRNPGSDGVPTWLKIQSVLPTRLLNDGDQISVGKATWEVVHTPGHSLGSICFFHKDQLLLFTGDTLFRGTYGNVSFPTSSPELMGESLARLAQLPNETTVFPGHGPSTTIEEERTWIAKRSRKF
jgi:glyoxylase-like metal-dependent hydrolase (beta-lactamase superfamily II)